MSKMVKLVQQKYEIEKKKKKKKKKKKQSITNPSGCHDIKHFVIRTDVHVTVDGRAFLHCHIPILVGGGSFLWSLDDDLFETESSKVIECNR